MTVEFNDALHYGLFLTGTTLTSQTGVYVRESEKILSALRSQGVFDTMVDDTSAPAHDKLWLDKNTDPATLKEWDSVASAWVEMTFDRLFGRAVITALTVSGGTGDAIEVDAPAAFISNRLYSIVPAADNTGATTIQVAGIGTYDVVYGDGSDLAASELIEGGNKVLLFANGRFEVLSSISIPGAGTVTATSLASAAADKAAIRNKLTVPVYVADRTAMKALDTTIDLYAYLGEAGREGTLKWQSADQSAILVGSAVTSASVDSGNGHITSTAHGLPDLCAVIVTSAANGLATNTIYWVHVVDDDTFILAGSITDAFAGTSVTLTGTTNFSVKQHFDPMEGYFVCPDSDITGASGAWKRPFNVPNTPLLHGASYNVASAASIQACIDFAWKTGLAVYIPGGGTGTAGSFLSDTDIIVRLRTGSNAPSVQIYGDGWNASRLTFTGSGVTKGLYYKGDTTTPNYAPTLRDVQVIATSSAARCVTAEGLNHPRFERVYAYGAKGAGFYFDTCYMTRLDQCLMSNCGSATEGTLTIDNSTTFMWLHSRISGANSDAIAGVMVDDTSHVHFIGGNVESTKGVPFKISSRSSRTTGVQDFHISGTDMENPGNDNPYIEVGNGWDGGTNDALKTALIRFSGSTAGTTSMIYGVSLAHTVGVEFANCNIALAGTPTAYFNLDSTSNIGVKIGPHPRAFSGGGTPWVYENGSQRTDAGPLTAFYSRTLGDPLLGSEKTLTGTTVSILVDDTQGGWYGAGALFNASATTVSTITGGRRGMVIVLRAANGNTTIDHSVSANGIRLKDATDRAMASGDMLHLYYTGTLWAEI